MRFRMVTVLPVAMDEVVAYMTESDLNDNCAIDLSATIPLRLSGRIKYQATGVRLLRLNCYLVLFQWIKRN